VRTGPFACAWILVAASSVARAQPTDAAAQAELLFEQGKSLLQSGDAAQACPKFAESMSVQPGIGTALWLGDCYERLGKTASAWLSFREAEGLARTRSDEPRQRIAGERIRALTPKLSTLLIVVEAPAPGIAIARDGLPVGSGSLGSELPVDPGTHTVEATAPGRVPWKAKVQVPPNAGHARIRVPALAVTSSAEARADEAHAAAPSAQPKIALGVAAAGVVALGFATFFGLRAKSAFDASNADGHCLDDGCDAAGLSLRDDAYGRATASTVAFTIGALALAAGAVLWLTAPSAPTAVRRSSR
jgi:hypothetical protein